MKILGYLNFGPRLACCLLVLLSSPGLVSGQTSNFKLNGIFTENMVLQRDIDLPIYGMEVMAVRVIGKPSSGDNPKQAFVACAELEAFAD